MTTYILSRTSPTNTTLSSPEGLAVYEISTPDILGPSQTTIKRGGNVIATIQWNLVKGSTITMSGKTNPIDEVFPRSGTLSMSRIWTTSSGEQFKWKDSAKLYCVSVESGLNLATYDRTYFSLFRDKKSTLDISSNAAHLVDDLVVTWVIAEKKARNRRRSQSVGSRDASQSREDSES
ncbi:unnamed protein product [Rhizoctonia solani]|uniref:DUF6593 domain-containing protein n=1 Tax=Rhizoctonia solani TaxID=456999 RepID=A0A8H2WWI7_9AGAM|nr:unnamed protein product [Rhizoctonia solani]